ncbi:MAG: SDR family NAD(P)-dependent oxidoreductase [Alphaproteobacteria bacterium]|jgi:NAD(P)-dependent dehydrogenase (short-subunit alcohol dehydrogenase family)|nr:SDR family NAD(P)-dependent oxidoreductase [Alphaproteobacteria bacterium]
MSPVTSQRIAVVTGASRGIGNAVARACAAAGDKVVAIARSQKALEALDDAVQAGGGEPVTLVPLDLKDYDGLDRLAGALFERFGRIDALAACAGVLGALTPMHQATPKMLEETLAANLIANARLIRAFHPLLQASPAGRAVFLTSNVASRPRAYWGAYAASKAGLEALARTWADELGVTAIKANLFNPGPTRTAMRARAYPGEDPMTLPSPEEVADQITPLLQAAWTENGATIGFVRSAG